LVQELRETIVVAMRIACEHPDVADAWLNPLLFRTLPPGIEGLCVIDRHGLVVSSMDE